MTTEAPSLSMDVVPSRLFFGHDRARRAKLIFAAAEEARHSGRMDEHEKLIARWRQMGRGAEKPGVFSNDYTVPEDQQMPRLCEVEP